MKEKIVDVASEFAALREQVITTNNTMQEIHATLTTLQNILTLLNAIVKNLPATIQLAIQQEPGGMEIDKLE